MAPYLTIYILGVVVGVVLYQSYELSKLKDSFAGMAIALFMAVLLAISIAKYGGGW